VFRQEFESSEWGYAGEHFLSATDVRACFDERAGRGPRKEGSYVVGLDVAQVRDRSAIVCCSAFAIPVRAGEPTRVQTTGRRLGSHYDRGTCRRDAAALRRLEELAAARPHCGTGVSSRTFRGCDRW
jgi:hypothetical protein